MTVKEAIDWCEQFTDNLVLANVATIKRTLGLQAMQNCKSALEKQIPQKVEYVNRHGGGYDLSNKDYFGCPSCKRRLRNTQKDPYCGKCGQALDWSDANDR